MGILTDIGQSVQRVQSWCYRDGQGKLVADAAGSMVCVVGASAGGGAAAVTGAVLAVRAAVVSGFFFFGATGFLVGGAAGAGCNST